MGLAASQARFLAITARKMNCEFQSMQIAQEKLSVTRDMEQASQEYQDALNTSKLVWETPDGEVYDLTYAMMMTPSNFNDYNAYLVTDTQGRVVLSPAMFAAAVAAGTIDEKGNPLGDFNISGRNAFLEALAQKGQVSKTIVEEIEKLGKNGYSRSGVGGEILDKTAANVMQTNNFIDYLRKATKIDENGKEVPAFTVFSDGDKNMLSDFLGEGSTYQTKPPSNLGKNEYTVSAKTNALNNSTLKELTMGDILSGDYVYTYNFGGQDGIGGDKNYNFEWMIRGLTNMFAEVLGYQGSSALFGKGICLDKQSAEAMDTAIYLTVQQFASNYNNVKNSADKSGDYNTGVTSGKQNTNFSVNLTNLANTLLTYYAMLLDGFEDQSYSIKDEKKQSIYVTDNLTYYFNVENTSGVSETDMLNADFYNQMYNVICMYGACTDTMKQEMVTDKAYLNNALKNGQLFISSLNTDGYFYPGHYTLNGHVGEIPDEDAIARAELEYEITKSKLNTKEESLELKMKNLDMEISSLTTEYDTVKNMISKGVEKVFTMFSS